MRIIVFPVILSSLTAPAIGQISSTGLVAHWHFTGNALDSSGNGHHGTPTAINYAVGRNGIPNTAAEFNGSTSGITVPYAANLNVVNYSICAIVKPTAFYTDVCQASYILERAGTTLLGYYSLGFSDNAFDQGNCSAADTSLYTFFSIAGNNSPSYTSAQYTPTITTQQWYSVVATYNSSQIRMYVNGVLKAIFSLGNNPLGVGNNGLSIGRAGWGNVQQYPWQFTGLIDDLRLYNRVLTDSEITIYHNPPPAGVAGVANEKSGIAIFPNPATNNLTVQFANSASSTYDIIDGVGRSVMAGSLIGTESTLNISSLAPGVYYIRVAAAAGVHVKSFVKQ